MGVITGQLIDRALNRCGIDTAPANVGRPMVETWLNEAQRELCAAGRLLATIWKGKSQANAEYYQLPGEFYQILQVEVRQPNLYRILGPMTLPQRNPDRTTVPGDVPSKFMVWGANDVSGSTDNKPILIFDKNFGDTSASYNVFVFARQKPKVMVDAGQDPEVGEYWQDIMLDYAEARIRLRLSKSDRTQVQVAQASLARFREEVEKSKEYRYDAMLVPIYGHDNDGIIYPWGQVNQ